MKKNICLLFIPIFLLHLNNVMLADVSVLNEYGVESTIETPHESIFTPTMLDEENYDALSQLQDNANSMTTDSMDMSQFSE